MPPCAQRVEPAASTSLVTSSTRRDDCRLMCSAVVRPAMPEPTTTTSASTSQPGSGAASRRGSLTATSPTLSISRVCRPARPPAAAPARARGSRRGRRRAVRGSRRPRPVSAASTPVAMVITEQGTVARPRLPGEQRARQRQRMPPIVRAEVDVAARQRQPVRLAHRLDADDLRAQIEVLGHQPDQRQLLVVLLAEVRAVGTHHVQELGHDGEDAGEVPGPHLALEQVADRPRLHGRPARCRAGRRPRPTAPTPRPRRPPRTRPGRRRACAGSGRGPRSGRTASG